MIFKYMKAHHAESFLREGTLRIGTLYEFRDMEKHGAVIGDKNEGQKSLYTHLEGRYTNENAPAISKKFIELGDGAAFENCTLVEQTDSPDCFLFCASAEYSAEMMAEFKADVCVVIDNLEGFYNAITKALSAKIGNPALFRGAHRCQYVARNLKHEEDHGIPGALIKDADYIKQKEIRAIWEPATPLPIGPVIIKCPEALKFCWIYPKPSGAR